ncbi:ABC transporter ATP-binding protein/permease [Streptomyces sp. RB6PN25]|uniref:ABC transporter ATP-binding protein/permease n=1 Tax=Streptomyces humicola TaxID=2953240 RepID=A0ABT1PYU4_9ACTN|nr:ABC transporter ATP-binding protein [Streptomyces humicola]MCQ4082845.1 ABC transporter ATP-binding protein/permease [Streptomyces humicola]
MAARGGSQGQQGWLRRITAHSWRYRRNVLLALGASLAGMAVTALVPLLPRVIIDDVIVKHTQPIAPWAVLMVVAALAVYACTYVRRFYGGRLALDVQYDLRNEMFASLARLDGARQDELNTGQVVGRATSDLQLIQGMLFMLPMMIGNLLLFVMSLIIMAVLSPLLTVIALAVAPALWFIADRSRKRLFPATWYAQGQAAAVAGVVDGAVTGVRVVKGFGQEEQEEEKLRRVSLRLFAARLRTIRLNARYNPSLQAVPALGQVAMLALGGWMAVKGEISLGTFVAFSTYLAQLTGPVRMLTMMLTIGQQARAGVERVYELIDTEPLVKEAPDARDLPADAVATVEFDAVTFAYGSDGSGGTGGSGRTGGPGGSDGPWRRARPVLDDFSLRVEPGETMAVVGASGSGKSTLSLLLPRFYDVTGGAVRVGGQDVRELTLDSLRAAIGLVPEDSFLFSDTIRANIGYGRPGATEEEILAAARTAQAHDFICELPEGYDTVVGEQGLTLSGGQRQRVALARAVLTDPRLLLLDDATSAVDARIEAEIHEALREVMAGRTTLLIAHRRSTLALADRIAVLDEGRLVDIGTHEQLEQRCARYRTLLTDPDELASDDTPADSAGFVEWDGESSAGAGGGTAIARGPAAGSARTWVPWEQLHSTPDGGPGHAPAEGPAPRHPVDGVTLALWPRERAAAAAADDAQHTPGPAAARPGIAGAIAGMPATPELLARVAALPAATDTPDVDGRKARAADPDFGLRSMLRGFRGPLLLSLVFVAADAIGGLLLPVLIRSGIDQGVDRMVLHGVWVASIAALVVVLLQWAAQVGETQLTGRTGERVLYSLRLKIFAHLQRLGLDFYERELAGRIMTRMTTDVDALSSFLQTGLVTAVVSLLTFFGILVALLALDAGLALTVFATLPPLVIATVVFRRKSVRAYGLARDKIAVVNADLQEHVAGMRVVQAFRGEQAGGRRFAERGDEYRTARVRGQWYISVYFPFVQFLSSVAAALVLIVGAGRVGHGTLTAGALVAYLLYIDLFFSPVQQLSQVFDGYQQASISLGRIRELLRVPTKTPTAEHPEAVAAQGLRGEIVFDDVSFAYGDGEAEESPEALSAIRLQIPAGQTVAFVGETGAGKSSLVKLVARFYDPTSGAIRVDGTDIRQYDPVGYRRRLGVVPQEPYLFEGTVRDAIAYGRPDATDAEVEAAARAVGAHAMIATFPDGYLHRVGERGRNLSAGQRQLLALARAELVDPDVLLLDEATAALDLATERLVNEAADRLAVRRTTLVVAHRLTTAARADRVVVMDRGRIVEDGTHRELLTRDGRYAELWRTYLGDEEPAVA